LFISVLTPQAQGQLQSEHEWKKEANAYKAQNKAIYSIAVMMMMNDEGSSEVKTNVKKKVKLSP
jgi:hypothetical protein